MSKTNKPAAVAIALAGGLALTGSAFAMEPLSQGYLLAGQEAAKAAEGKCGEGKCGMAKADTDKDGKVSQAEFNAAHPDKAAKFAEIDTNKDGFIDAAEHKAHAGAKGAEGKCGEGKCGEGKCGGTKKAGETK
ncbi:hypothetical protein LJR168_002720 [Pseudoxanthomonas sp. LjRoot168]|uniref:HvfA family oxazolone/thioamide-modified RiPP metallophore n=1 Tax=unclassified Pseudoxanthomonas TaxID=2645906 RepID=UPI0025D50866|nr:hypothetical protein [Pseudoxanthomonas sp.]